MGAQSALSPGLGTTAAMYIDDLSGTGGSVGIGVGVGGGEVMPAMYANALSAIGSSSLANGPSARCEPASSLRSAAAASTGFASEVAKRCGATSNC